MDEERTTHTRTLPPPPDRSDESQVLKMSEAPPERSDSEETLGDEEADDFLDYLPDRPEEGSELSAEDRLPSILRGILEDVDDVSSDSQGEAVSARRLPGLPPQAPEERASGSHQGEAPDLEVLVDGSDGAKSPMTPKYKPDRCHHCRVCRICILKMDHHCPWIYNCVGFRNYKYFFLLLLYTSIDCAFIVFSMLPSVRAGTQPTTPFMTMFWLMFGETLAGFLGVLVFLFFCFHIYLMMKAMTTIEFCEKSHSKGSFNASTYDRGVVGNVKAVLGDDWWLWLLPTSRPPGRGVSFISEETRLSKDMEAGRGLRRRAHDHPEGTGPASAPKRRSDAKPNACGGTGSTGQSEEDSHSGSGSEVPDVGSSRDPRQVPNYGAADVGSPVPTSAAEK